MWWTKRRPEIVEDFDREILGRVPANTPKVNWEVVSTTQEKVGEVPVVTKKLAGHVDNSAYPKIKVTIELELTTPANASGPVPVIMEIGFQPEFMAAIFKKLSRRNAQSRPCKTDPPGSSRCSPVAGAMQRTCPTACRPITARD